MIHPIIMAGGAGNRLWPLSRELYPKQFLTVTGDMSMLQKTISRLSGFDHVPPMLICNEEHRFIAAEQLRDKGIEHSGIILEPFGRNTAPAIALAAIQVLKNSRDSDPVLLVLASDHHIEDEDVFNKSVIFAKDLAQSGQLVTFGIVPDHAETGYGYIKCGDKLNTDHDCYTVECFVEKPDLSKAETYVASGDYLWNSGMFMFKASVYLDELKKHCPEIFACCESAINNTHSDMDFIRVDKGLFEACPSDSIDYAVMENTDSAVVVPMNAGWCDVGSWSALWDLSDKDTESNVQKGDIFALNSKNNYLSAEDKLIAVIGVEDLIVVETKDAVLVANKAQVQDVKSVVDYLKKNNRYEYKYHREVYRPWGKYDAIDFGKRDQVKRITVNPGEKLSIQMHHHRSEHWIVVSGTAKVTNGSKTFLVSEDQSTYIPLGTVHALENPGKIPLEMIEVQTGSYLGEDDIVRFDDRYGRLED